MEKIAFFLDVFVPKKDTSMDACRGSVLRSLKMNIFSKLVPMLFQVPENAGFQSLGVSRLVATSEQGVIPEPI